MPTTASSEPAPLILVDGSSYLFRAYFALPPLSTADGFPTGAIRGVIAMLRKLAKDYEGSPIAVVFDAPGKTFRDELYPDYKGTRPDMPDDLRQQIEPVHEIIRAMGLPLLRVSGVEADDVIGTLATQATAAKRNTIISTSDKDMAQLVSDHVTLVNTMSDTRMDRDGVIEKFGVPPELIIDQLALAGDSVDNIPGVEKVGVKTAAKWLNEHGDLDAVMAGAESFKGKLGENLRAALGHLPMSRTLATIKCDVELEQSIDELIPAAPDVEALREHFLRYEFKGWVAELEGDDAAVEERLDAAAERNYELVLTKKAFDDWLKRLRKAKLFAFDTETTSVDYMAAELVGVSFAVAPGEAAYVPVAHNYPGAPEQLSLTDVLEALKPILEDPKRKKVGQNLKYDLSVLARYGVTLNGIAHDTMLESYVFNSVGSRHNMDDLAQHYLGLTTIKFEDVAGKGAKQLTFDQVPLETAGEYAAEDADNVFKLDRCQAEIV